ncbi:sulfotransferase family protein [Nitrococcus mobilis]|nr:sulfotransferase [Nitrococcus mobilis]
MTTFNRQPTIHGVRTLPTFFIVGAPRCGTTAMSRYLSKHPKICFARPKEPHFFTSPLATSDTLNLQRDYIERFYGHCSHENRILGEGSVSYLYSKDALEHILRINPNARFIVMLRSPVAMLQSYHARLLYILQEDVGDFRQAWQLQSLRAQGRRVPPTCSDPRHLQYTEIGRLGSYLEQIFSLAGRQRCHVIVFDDFISDPSTTYRGVLSFIGAKDDGRSVFSPVRSNRRYRSRWLQRLVKRPPTLFVGGVHPHAPKSERKRSLLKRAQKRLQNWNTINEPRAKLDSRMHRELAQTFRGEIMKLSELLERDLSHWVDG